MKKLFTLLALLLCAVANGWADDPVSPYTISWLNKATVPGTSDTSVSSGGVTWDFSATALGEGTLTFEKNDRGIKASQLATLSMSTSAFASLGEVTKVVVNIGRNKGGTNKANLNALTMEVKVNNVSYGTSNLTEIANKDYTFSPTGVAEKGNVELTITNTVDDAVYFGSVTVYYVGAVTSDDPVDVAAGSKTFDYKASGANATSWEQEPVTVTTNATGIDNSNKYLKGNSGDLTVTVAGADVLVTNVVLTYQDTGHLPDTFTADDGTELTTSGTTQTWANPAGKRLVKFTLASCRLKKIEVTYVPFVTISVNSATGYGTYATDKALDFTGNSLKAYIVSSLTSTAATTEQLTAVPAEEGIIVKASAAGSYDVPVATSTPAAVTNKLKAAVEATTVTASETYVMNEGTFKKYTGTDMPANRAYLLASDVPGGVSAPALVLSFIDGSTTGIQPVAVSDKADGAVYNLAGQRVAQPSKGLYIVNGKKILVK